MLPRVPVKFSADTATRRVYMSAKPIFHWAMTQNSIMKLAERGDRRQHAGTHAQLSERDHGNQQGGDTKL